MSRPDEPPPPGTFRQTPATDGRCVRMGPHLMGAGHPPALWPDIDVYFRGDEDLARHLIDKVAQAGCRFLKGAVLHRASLCAEGATHVQYYDKVRGETVSEPYAQVIARHVVPLDVMRRLMGHASAAGLGLVLSVYDSEGLAFAREMGALAVKLPSSNITHRALIEEVAASGLPMVMDTGRSKFSEIVRAVGWAQGQGATGRLVLQHSPPGPPAPPRRFHLRMMAYMADRFECPVGLSDHHSGLDMLPLAVALGACVFEKGLAIDGADTDIDMAHAMPVSRLPEAMRLLEESWQALGAPLRPDGEVPTNPVDRMGLIASRPIAAGEKLSRDAIGFAFPPMGIGAEEIDAMLDGRARVDMASGAPITWDVVELPRRRE